MGLLFAKLVLRFLSTQALHANDWPPYVLPLVNDELYRRASPDMRVQGEALARSKGRQATREIIARYGLHNALLRATKAMHETPYFSYTGLAFLEGSRESFAEAIAQLEKETT